MFSERAAEIAEQGQFVAYMKAYFDAEDEIVARRKRILRAVLMIDCDSGRIWSLSRQSLISQHRLLSADRASMNLNMREESANLNDVCPVTTAKVQNRRQLLEVLLTK